MLVLVTLVTRVGGCKTLKDTSTRLVRALFAHIERVGYSNPCHKASKIFGYEKTQQY